MSIINMDELSWPVTTGQEVQIDGQIFKVTAADYPRRTVWLRREGGMQIIAQLYRESADRGI